MLKNKLFAGGIAGLALLAASGCVNPDYDGEGNDFVIEGEILDIGERSIKLMPSDIAETSGKADDWFEIGDETRIHDNYENEWCDEKTVDNVIYTLEGGNSEQSLEDLNEGDWVEVEGRLRESKTSCGKVNTWDYRPVYEEVREIMR